MYKIVQNEQVERCYLCLLGELGINGDQERDKVIERQLHN